MKELYGVVISNQKRVLFIKGIFTDYYDAVRWLRKYITDRLNDCMYLGGGNTHIHVDWHSSDSDILESADIDFCEGSYNARIVPIVNLPKQKYNDTDLDAVTGINKYMVSRLKEGFNGNDTSDACVLDLNGMKFRIGGFQRTDMNYQNQVGYHAYVCGYSEIVAITGCNSNAKEYIVFIDQLTREQVEKILKVFFVG